MYFFRFNLVFNINHWINFRSFNLFLIYYIFIYKFKVGYLNDKTYYIIFIIFIIIFLIGILKKIVSITGINL